MISGIVAILIYSLALGGFGAVLGYFYGAVAVQRQYVAEQQRYAEALNQQQAAMYGHQQGAIAPNGVPMMYLDAPARPIGFRMD